MSRIKGSLGTIVIADETLNPGTNLTNMRRTLQKNPYDPVNFIKIQCKIPEGLNFENIADDIELNFAAEIAKFRMEDTKSLTNMQTRHDELLVSLSKEGYEQINYTKT